jgi:hypothetical protein
MYDTCAYEKTLNESTGQFAYTMYSGKYENCAKCRIDLESDLRGQTRPASLCPKNKFQPKCDSKGRSSCDGLPCDPAKQYPLVNQPSCQMIRYPPIPKTPQFQPMECQMPRY